MSGGMIDEERLLSIGFCCCLDYDCLSTCSERYTILAPTTKLGASDCCSTVIVMFDVSCGNIKIVVPFRSRYRSKVRLITEHRDAKRQN